MGRLQTAKQLYGLLDSRQRFAVVGMFGLMLVGMVLEAMSIGLILPAVAIMSRDDFAEMAILRPYLQALGNPSQAELVAGAMIVLVAAFAIKSLFLAFMYWRQAGFSFGLRRELSRRLFAGYLRKPWTFHLQRNSAELTNTVTVEMDYVALAMQSVLTLATECLVLIGLATLLILFEPIGALGSVAIIGLAAWAYVRVVRKRTAHWGRAYREHSALRLQHIQQGLGGAKEVKLLGREGEFLARYDEHNAIGSEMMRRQTTLQQLPRLMLELLAVIGLAILVLTIMSRDNSAEMLVPTLGLFGGAAFRLLPSAGRAMTCIQQLRFSAPIVDRVAAEMREIQRGDLPKAGGEVGFEQAIELENVGYRYPGTDSPAISAVSLTVPRNATVGIVGESGAGKSTIVDIILGVLTPTEGHVLIDGIDYLKDLRGWQDRIGYVPQAIFLTDDTLRRNIAFGVAEDQIDEVAVRRAIRAAQLDGFIAVLPDGLETMVGERGVRLSGGQRQRIGIARALYNDPAVLVLDEATSALDVATEEDVMAAVRALHGDKTIIIVAHRASAVRHCDRIFRIAPGGNGAVEVALNKDESGDGAMRAALVGR